jgi:hypothetical protein
METPDTRYSFLRVKLEPGMFDNEYTIILSTEGREISSVVGKESVRTEQEPTELRQGRGLLRVRVIGSAEGKTLIDLPRPSFTSQPRLRISERDLVPL